MTFAEATSYRLLPAKAVIADPTTTGRVCAPSLNVATPVAQQAMASATVGLLANTLGERYRELAAAGYFRAPVTGTTLLAGGRVVTAVGESDSPSWNG